MAGSASMSSPSLTFPRSVFAAVSPHPFLQAHLSATQAPLRANHRAAHEFRRPKLNTGSLTHCNGSAVVRLGNTSVVCGVRAEILQEQDIPPTHIPSRPSKRREDQNKTEDDEDDEDDDDDDDEKEVADLRLLVPNVELSTGSTPSHVPGNAPSTFSQALITRIRSLLHSNRLVRASDLRILHSPSVNPADSTTAEPDVQELKGYWVLYLDVFFISLDGNAFDASWLSILAALRDTLLPRAFFHDEHDGILCSDRPQEARRLRLRGMPVPSTFAVFEGTHEEEVGEGGGGAEEGGKQQLTWILSDPDAFEEGVCRENVTVVVDVKGGKKGPRDASVCRIEKNGGRIVDRHTMQELVKRAMDRWEVVERILNESG